MTSEKPKTCGECERFLIIPNQGTFCTPISDKHGYTIVDQFDTPPDDCCYDLSICVKCNTPFLNGRCSC